MPPSPRLPSLDINMTGESFIEPHERAGLPVPRSQHKGEHEFSESELHATHVVHAHSRNSKRFYRRRSHSTASWTNGSPDEEDGGQTNPPMARTRGGILAALLTLYDRGPDVASVSDTQRHPRVSPSHSLHDLVSASGRGLATVSKALHLQEPRPRRERNAAGVWGSLIASTTGTLVGATAPTHSTIAPDVKRPGYHLSRYAPFFLLQL
jgi:hypothetical protein